MDGSDTYTFDHLEAAACMWEHVLERIRRVRKGELNPWDEYRNAYGMAALRTAVIRHAPTLEDEVSGGRGQRLRRLLRLGIRPQVHGGSRHAHPDLKPLTSWRDSSETA